MMENPAEQKPHHHRYKNGICIVKSCGFILDITRKKGMRTVVLHYDEKLQKFLCGLCWNGHCKLCKNLSGKCECPKNHEGRNSN